MQVTDPEALKVWLTSTLAPICDADPAALAKYVLALLRKDKDETELKAFCIDQLDVFLVKETNVFVDLMFEVLKDKSYMEDSKVAPADQKSSPAAAKSKIENNGEKERRGHRTKPKVADRIKEDHNDPTEPLSRRQVQVRQKISPPHGERRRRSPVQRTTRISRRRSRSRSRSPRHGRDLLAKTGSAHISRESRSPLPDSVSPEDVKPRSSNLDSKIATRSKGRCRDYDEKGFCLRGDLCPFDHGNDPVVVEEVSLPGMVAAVPTPSVLSAPPTNIQSHNVYTHNLPAQHFHTGMPLKPPGVDVPMSGDSAHSVNVSLNSARAPAPMHPFSAPPPFAPGNHNMTPGFAQIPPPPIMHGLPAGAMRFPPMMHPGMQPSGMVEALAALPGPPLMSTTVGGRNPANSGGGDRGRGRSGVFERLGPRQPPPDATTLLLRRVPPRLNNISRLNQHFCQFGSIVNIQVQYGKQVDAAVIQYSSHEEAENAYRSNIPILNNRFIRVFWFNEGKRVMQGEEKFEAVEDGKGNKRAIVVNSRGGISQTVYNPTAIQSKATAMQTRSQSQSEQDKSENVGQQEQIVSQAAAAATAKKTKVLEAQKQRAEFQRKKVELLEKHLKQQKILLNQLTKPNLDRAKRTEIMKTLRVLDKAITSLNEDLSVKKPKKVARSQKDVEEQIALYEKEIAKLENDESPAAAEKKSKFQQIIDLLKRQLKAIAVADAANAHLSAAKSKTVAAPTATSTPVLSGGAGSRKRSLPVLRSAEKHVDKRPRALFISNFRAEDADNVSVHFKQYGQMEEFTMAPNRTSASVTFKLRREAEMALSLGKAMPTDSGQPLKIRWAHLPSPSSTPDLVDVAVKLEAPDDNSTPDEPTLSVINRQLSAEEILASLAARERKESGGALDDNSSDGDSAGADDVDDDDEETDEDSNWKRRRDD